MLLLYYVAGLLDCVAEFWCWVVLLGGVAGWWVVLLECIVGMYCWVVLLDCVAGLCCWVVLLGCVAGLCCWVVFAGLCCWIVLLDCVAYYDAGFMGSKIPFLEHLYNNIFPKLVFSAQFHDF